MPMSRMGVRECGAQAAVPEVAAATGSPPLRSGANRTAGGRGNRPKHAPSTERKRNLFTVSGNEHENC